MTLRLTIALLMILSFSAASIADVTLPSYPKGKGKYCVEPTDVMRRDHFEYLMHHRQISVHLGVRTKKHSLVGRQRQMCIRDRVGCVDCHASQADDGTYIPVNEPGQFCRSCHLYTAVKIDCFSCHAAVPDAVVKQ